MAVSAGYQAYAKFLVFRSLRKLSLQRNPTGRRDARPPKAGEMLGRLRPDLQPKIDKKQRDYLQLLVSEISVHSLLALSPENVGKQCTMVEVCAAQLTVARKKRGRG